MPIFKKNRGHIFAVKFSAKEQKAIDAEILRLEMNSVILWVLHERFGFGKKRLRRFFESYAAELDALEKRYEMGNEDMAWLCRHKLERYGIDIAEWNKEGKQ